MTLLSREEVNAVLPSGFFDVESRAEGLLLKEALAKFIYSHQFEGTDFLADSEEDTPDLEIQGIVRGGGAWSYAEAENSGNAVDINLAR